MADAYSSLLEFAGQMDVDLSEMVLNSLSDYRLKPEDQVTIDAVRDALLRLEWEKIEALVSEKQ